MSPSKLSISRVLSIRLGGIETPLDELTQSRLEREQRHLCRVLTGHDDPETVKSVSFGWLQEYIEARAKHVWNDLIVRVINGLDETSSPSEAQSRTQLFAVIATIVELIAESPDITLEDIVENLQVNDENLREQNLPALLRDSSELIDIHLVFHLVGWITALWDPVIGDSSQTFQVSNDNSKSRKRSLLHTPTVRSLSVGIQERNTPIYQLVMRFGDLFPNSDSLLNEQDIGNVDFESACITAAYISFHNLVNVLNVQLQWTKTLNQHLEYDRRRNVLHVFSAPSLCELSLRSGSDSILVKLFDQYRTERDAGCSSYQHADFRIYLTEVLLSYRLIFGLHKKSRKAIKPHLLPSKVDGRQSTECDPILHILCTKENTSPEMQAFFLELGVEDIGNYVSLEEFQFFGKRLLRLERISKSQNPSGLRRFWNDRRDSTAWFATWAVLILGGGTLILQAFQLVFQIYQPMK